MLFPQWQDKLFDTHCHLNDPAFDVDRADVVERAAAAGVECIVDMAIDMESSRRTLENARRFPGKVFATAGIDPQVVIPNMMDDGNATYMGMRSKIGFESAVGELTEFVAENHKELAMIGETGMDNYWLPKVIATGNISQREADESLDLQRKLFLVHIELGKKYNLPLSIHSRGIEDECTDLIVHHGGPAKGIFHCFTGTPAQARRIINLGWGVGLGGMLTFKSENPQKAIWRELLAENPLNKDEPIPQQLYARGIYLETDAPYLAPEPHRGTRNEPAYVYKLISALQAQ